MKTGDLIRALAADNDARAMTPGRALALASIPATTVALGLHLAILGLRPHLFLLLGDARILFKIGLTILLAVLSCRMVLRCVTPGASLRSPALWLAIVPTLLMAAILAELFLVPEKFWGIRLFGSNAAACLTSIPFLAAVPLAGALLPLRQGAPENPGLAGAADGLFAGAIGAACPDDSPLFVATWYSLAIGFVVAAGALMGRLLLRW